MNTASHDTEANRYATLKAQFAKHGHTLDQSGSSDGLGAISYLTERWGMARHLATLADAEKFLLQEGGPSHE